MGKINDKSKKKFKLMKHNDLKITNICIEELMEYEQNLNKSIVITDDVDIDIDQEIADLKAEMDALKKNVLINTELTGLEPIENCIKKIFSLLDETIDISFMYKKEEAPINDYGRRVGGVSRRTYRIEYVLKEMSEYLKTYGKKYAGYYSDDFLNFIHLCINHSNLISEKIAENILLNNMSKNVIPRLYISIRNLNGICSNKIFCYRPFKMLNECEAFDYILNLLYGDLYLNSSSFIKEDFIPTFASLIGDASVEYLDLNAKNVDEFSPDASDEIVEATLVKTNNSK